MLTQIGLCRSSSKVCNICKQPIKKKEAFKALGPQHYCCSLEYNIPKSHEREIKELFQDFYNYHKTRLSIR